MQIHVLVQILSELAALLQCATEMEIEASLSKANCYSCSITCISFNMILYRFKNFFFLYKTICEIFFFRDNYVTCKKDQMCKDPSRYIQTGVVELQVVDKYIVSLT